MNHRRTYLRKVTAAAAENVCLHIVVRIYIAVDLNAVITPGGPRVPRKKRPDFAPKCLITSTGGDRYYFDHHLLVCLFVSTVIDGQIFMKFGKWVDYGPE